MRPGVILIVFCSCLTSQAGTKRLPYLRTGTFQKLDACGFGITVFKDAKGIPAMAVEPKILIGRRGKETMKAEAFPPAEYWLREQFVSQWQGPGARIVVYQMTYRAPKDLPQIVDGLITRKAFAEWAPQAAFKGPDAAGEWLKYAFKGEFGMSDKKMRGKASTVWPCTVARTSDQDELHRQCFVIGPSKSLDRYFIVLYELDPSAIDVAKSLRAIESSAKSCAVYAVKKPTVRAEKKGPESDIQKSRQKAINSIANLPNWWHLDTTNYILLSNVKDRRTIVAVKNDLELCRNAFETCLPAMNPITAISAVKLFQGRDEYLAYVGKDYQKTSGLWMPGKRELVVSPVVRNSKREQRAQTVAVVYHEGFHQYLFYACGEKSTSVWFNEGHAGFFEGLELGRTRFEVNLVDHHARALAKLVRSEIPLDSFLKMSYAEFYRGDLKTVQTRYSVVYGLTYFLNKGSSVLRTKQNYAEIPLRYYRTFVETGDRDKANEAAWGTVDMAQFSKDFHAFWADAKLVKRSERYRFSQTRKTMLAKFKIAAQKKK